MKALLISDFSINNLSGYLKNELAEFRFQTSIAPFNQVHQVLLDFNLECWQDEYDCAIAWTQPERVLKSFQSFLLHEPIEIEVILDEVEKFASLILPVAKKVKKVFIANWTVDLTLNHKGFLNTKPNIGVVDVLSQMNFVLTRVLSQAPNVYVLESSKWLLQAGENAYSPKLWYLSKTPFHSSVFASAATDISSHIRNLDSIPRKVIVTDLDNTLWGGVIGDVGAENLILGGHNAKGEAFRDFQLGLKSMQNRGVVLAIASKNEELLAMSAIEQHPEMVLRKKDFVAWRINWEDKAKNIFEIAQELNLGLEAVVFLDDNPFERERVKHALPDVFVPDLPTDPMLYKSFLLKLNCFNSISSSEEDLKRTELYALEKERTKSKEGFSSLEKWLESIDIKVKCEALQEDNFQRVLQLLNKTNQMNLSTCRYTESELLVVKNEGNIVFYAFSVMDKFGDAGLTGVIGVKQVDNSLILTDFLLSCRVIGRKVEETMLSVAIDLAVQKGCSSFIANYVQTYKNKPCLDFFKSSGFLENGYQFTWECKKDYVRPFYVDLDFSA
jgi:FkbH-like protein